MTYFPSLECISPLFERTTDDAMVGSCFSIRLASEYDCFFLGNAVQSPHSRGPFVKPLTAFFPMGSVRQQIVVVIHPIWLQQPMIMRLEGIMTPI